MNSASSRGKSSPEEKSLMRRDLCLPVSAVPLLETDHSSLQYFMAIWHWIYLLRYFFLMDSIKISLLIKQKNVHQNCTAWIFRSYFLFYKGIMGISINPMKQRNWKLWEWKLTKVSGDSLKLAQCFTSIWWQEHLIIWSELNQKRPQLRIWYLIPTIVILHGHIDKLWQVTATVDAQFKWQCYLMH